MVIKLKKVVKVVAAPSTAAAPPLAPLGAHDAEAGLDTLAEDLESLMTVDELAGAHQAAAGMQAATSASNLDADLPGDGAEEEPDVTVIDDEEQVVTAEEEHIVAMVERHRVAAALKAASADIDEAILSEVADAAHIAHPHMLPEDAAAEGFCNTSGAMGNVDIHDVADQADYEPCGAELLILWRHKLTTHVAILSERHSAELALIDDPMSLGGAPMQHNLSLVAPIGFPLDDTARDNHRSFFVNWTNITVRSGRKISIDSEYRIKLSRCVGQLRYPKCYNRFAGFVIVHPNSGQCASHRRHERYWNVMPSSMITLQEMWDTALACQFDNSHRVGTQHGVVDDVEEPCGSSLDPCFFCSRWHVCVTSPMLHCPVCLRTWHEDCCEQFREEQLAPSLSASALAMPDAIVTGWSKVLPELFLHLRWLSHVSFHDLGAMSCLSSDHVCAYLYRRHSG
jgi:hypothetical protein